MSPDDAIQPPPGFTTPPPAAAPAIANPWERRAETGAVRAIWDTFVLSLSRPGDLFTGTPRSGGLGAPLAYAVIVGTFGMVVSSLWQLGFRALGMAVSSHFTPEAVTGDAAEKIAGLAVPIVILVFSPLIITIGSFIGAGLMHLALMILGAGRHGFEGTFRALAYAQGPMIFNAVPFVGGLVGWVWTTVLQVIGISKMQETEWWRALIALLLFPCACACIGVIAAFAIAAMVAGRAGS